MTLNRAWEDNIPAYQDFSGLGDGRSCDEEYRTGKFCIGIDVLNTLRMAYCTTLAKLRIDPCWDSIPFAHSSSVNVNECQHRHSDEKGDKTMGNKGPGEPHAVQPRRNNEGVDKCREIEHDGIEDDDRHALQWVRVDNVGTHGSVSHLNTRTDYKQVSQTAAGDVIGTMGTYTIQKLPVRLSSGSFYRRLRPRESSPRL